MRKVRKQKLKEQHLHRRRTLDHLGSRGAPIEFSARSRFALLNCSRRIQGSMDRRYLPDVASVLWTIECSSDLDIVLRLVTRENAVVTATYYFSNRINPPDAVRSVAACGFLSHESVDVDGISLCVTLHSASCKFAAAVAKMGFCGTWSVIYFRNAKVSPIDTWERYTTALIDGFPV